MDKGATIFWNKESKSLVAFRDKATVLCISTIAHSNLLLRGNKLKPEAIHFYNLTMKGVDQFDQNIEYYRYNHRFAKWWKNCFVYLLDIAIYNAFIMFKASSSLETTYLDFRTQLAILFTGYYPMNVDPAQVIEDEEEKVQGKKHVFESLIKPKKCCYCLSLGKRSNSAYQCSKCKVPLHQRCFHKYHTPF